MIQMHAKKSKEDFPCSTAEIERQPTLEMKISKLCEVRFKADVIFVFTYVNTPYGSFANVPFTKLSKDEDPVTVGNTVLGLLRAIPDMQVNIDLAEWRKKHSEHLASLGFKNYNAFIKNSVALSVKLEEQQIAVIPKALRAGEGYVSLEEHKTYSPPDAGELGRQIYDGRKYCG
jgi:hypothetical protein